ncbi:LysR family transcriptional regulator [Nonomuraea endophytica]|uniref:DNA-binding transcriptional LysR family regulator n=1 Tax=Nonomuraea endophytica TaxID=714136 RepID=A0A7W8A336_9ACTN|nr:LysR family transcriptional regulator [Nonomuraea endophytica]MBB5078614.1 DNA-binding transcriptional LysR family regulator [Nonomuraea endophytica]
MTLDDLRVFLAVCEAGNLSAVARTMSCSQSAVSQHIRRLEREVGLALFERLPRGVALTPAGRVLRRGAADGLGGLDATLRLLSEMERGEGGTVRITTGATSVRHFLAEGVAAFRARHPEAVLEFQTGHSSTQCMEAVRDHDADLAWVTMGPPVHEVEQRPALELPWVLAVRDDDPLASRTHLEPADLAAIRYIELPERSTSRTWLETHLAGHGIRLAASAGVADWDTALLLAELGIGHALVPAMPGWGRRLRPIAIPWLPALTVGWAVRQWRALSPLVLEFAETVSGSAGGTAVADHPR